MRPNFNYKACVGAFHYHNSISGLVVKSIVAIDWPRVRFPADAIAVTFA
jgi:hypothetical protein